MKFFFPDTLDLVDPSFDFTTEKRSPHRMRHRDDQYAHEAFPEPPYDGLLISRASVEGKGEGSRYSMAQRQRLLRVGAREFFRVAGRPLEVMGDCGAFSYVSEPEPPVTVDEVIDFYEACQLDLGVSIDHIILANRPDLDRPPVPTRCGEEPDKEELREWRHRQEITLTLAAEFLRRHKARGCRFAPVGAAQGWSPKSLAHCVDELQKMGYTKVGLGGLVPLKTPELLDCVAAAAAVRKGGTEFHLFGVTRLDVIEPLARLGVTSFDSTSPLRQAFKDDKDNYYTSEGPTYVAVRVPQVEGNVKLGQRIRSGAVNQEEALRRERACLEALAAYGRHEQGLEEVLARVSEYSVLAGEKRDRTRENRRTLSDRPWERCPCAICRQLGVHVVLFRGAERNRRRGFHNLYVTYQRLHRQLAEAGPARAKRGGGP